MSFRDYKEKMYETGKFFIPGYMMGGIFRWIEDGVYPGGFLTAVISDKLFDAVGRADDANVVNLPAYVKFFYNKAPAGCWGSKEVMKEWAKNGGLNGLMKKENENGS